MTDRDLPDRLIDAGVPAGTAELYITREWAILAGQNDCTTDTLQQCHRPPPHARTPRSCRSTLRNSADLTR